MRQHTIHTPYLIGEVHCYSTEINGELVLFDSGPPTSEAFAALKSQLDISRLKYLFLTHCHIDHYGLAAMIAENSDARIFIPRADARMVRRHAEGLDRLITLLADVGCTESITRFIREKMEREHRAAHIPDSFEIIEESDVPAKLGIDWLGCPGHSQSDFVYLCGEHAITGDILLRNIFQVPILDVDTETFVGRFRNYDAYCISIVSLRRLRGYRIHPGHRGYVDGVDATILFYIRKLLGRADQIKQFAHGDSILDIVRALFGDISKNPFFVHMKISEIVFIRDFLDNPGRLKASLEFLGLFEQVRDLYRTVVEDENGDQLMYCST
jgi:hydroxyacylglutathione hydrolase